MTPTTLEAVLDESHSPVEYGLSSELEDTTVKREVLVSPETGSWEVLAVVAVAGKRATVVEGDSCAELVSGVKTEIGIAFASKNAATCGELYK